jgi:bifunctional non-homologous end joining protein LigD
MATKGKSVKSVAKKPTKKAASRSPKDEVEAQLARYRSMRDFEVTAEPSGSGRRNSAQAKKSSGLPFVVQKHAATRLHYDFRLGWRGVLKSWAVTKGPSYVPADKRLAVEVEDHPMEYGGFEGTIPQGQYGGGTVMLWDEGTWEPQPGVDVDASLKAGNLKFLLHGKKLKGKWALIRMGGNVVHEGKPNWLLIKEHDDYERSPDEPAITEAEPDSVLTKRSLDEIAMEHDHVWQSKAAKGVEKKMSGANRLREKLRAKLGGATEMDPAKSYSTSAGNGHRYSGRAHIAAKKSRTAAVAAFVQPQLAVQASAPPAGNDWLHEIKYDGYRMQAICDGKHVKLLTRSGLDWSHRMASVCEALAALKLKDCTLDGEIVVLNAQGQSDFAALQAAFEHTKNSPLLYYVFDVLRANGEDVRPRPLVTRKKVLRELLKGASPKAIRYSEHAIGTGQQMFDEACKLGAEGIVSKRGDAPYRGGRQPDWIKVKCYRRQELVIGGFTLPAHASRGIGALLLGYYENGKLISAGRTGTGFTAASGTKLRERLEKLKTEAMPFQKMGHAASKGAVWVKPELVCEVSFATWTADGSVRQASFQGLRQDKPAKDVRREEAMPIENLTNKAEKNPQDYNLLKRSASSKSQKKSATGNSVEHTCVRLTHPAKILDAQSGVSKQMLADYLAAVSEAMLPHVEGRPVSLLRCPEGTGRPCFYQKHTSKGMPDGMAGVAIPDRKGGPPEEYVTINSTEGLIGTAQMGALEIHPWGSRNGSLEKPDRLIFDLDPDTSLKWTAVTRAAEQVRKLLQKYGLESFVKLSGGKGLHVVAPIVPEHEWPEIKAFCKQVAQELESSAPDRYLIKMAKAERVGKIFIDYMRNERGATAIAPWGARARAGMAAAVPLAWSELLESTKMPVLRVADFQQWQSRVASDPWEKMLALKQHLQVEALRDSAA